QVTGLSATEPTVVYWEDTGTGPGNSDYLFIYAPPTQGESILVAAPSVYSARGTQDRAFIPTTHAPVTVTGYTDNQDVTICLGQDWGDGGTVYLTGSGGR